jgi:anti-sigma factor RsiW
MTDFSATLSAYLDGELDPSAALAVQARLGSDPAAQAELDRLLAAEAQIAAQFDDMLNDPVPLTLARQIKSLPLPQPEPQRSQPVRGLIAASLALFLAGGTAGYLVKDRLFTAPVVAQGGWLQDIADYQSVYTSQTRHLVEVGADDAAHLVTWLSASVGTDFTIPDLGGFGLEFQGGRLLVANGKPVAQLMYTLADGTVVALCFQAGAPASADSLPVFNRQTINAFDMVSWTAQGTAYVIIGPHQQPDLDAIAVAAAAEV